MTRLYYVEVELYSFILFGTGSGLELPETGASGVEAGESGMVSSPAPGCRHTCEETFNNRKVPNKKISYLGLEAQTTWLYYMKVELVWVDTPVTDRVKTYAFNELKAFYPGRRVHLVKTEPS